MSSENQQSTTYQNLIKEAYIDPIRSAILIDDDFPMLDEYLLGKVGSEKSNETLTKLLATCRAKPNQWLVDVHNGKVNVGDESEPYRHLHHSDLMILDYHLDGDDTNDRALKILRSLASNNYFNLVVVYTKGTTKELQDRVLEIAQGLIFNRHSNEIPEVPDSISAWEVDEEDIVTTLKNELNAEAMLFLMQENDIANADLKSYESLTPLINLFAQRKREIKGGFDNAVVLNWLMKEKILGSDKSFSPSNLGRIDFTVHGSSNEANWIRTDNLFVTVIAKSTDPSQIPNLLLAALGASEPSPHRLLMSKMRNCLDDRGVGAEAAIIRKENIQAGLLWQILQSASHELPWKLQETIERHWEQLATEVEGDIHEYGMRLFNTVIREHEDDKNVGIKKFTTIDFGIQECKNDVTDELNSFICSRRPSGVHLMPGHIFCIKDQNGEKNYWICLSPACDLVPAQNKGKWKEHKIMQFTAVKLNPISDQITSKKLNTNEYLFIEVDGKILRFCYRDVDPASKPVWEQFFAIENGLMKENKIKFLSIHQYDVANIKMESILLEAEIVSQLRYEYAINLMQKLGTNLTRVGLDFISIN